MPKTRAPKGSRFQTPAKGAAKAAGKHASRPVQGLPDRETLLKFLRENGEAAKADIAHAFGLKGADRRALREMDQLRTLQAAEHKDAGEPPA